jgi:hypothetical protein
MNLGEGLRQNARKTRPDAAGTMVASRVSHQQQGIPFALSFKAGRVIGPRLYNT